MTKLTTQIHTYLTKAPTSNFLDQEVEMVAHWAGRDNLLWQVRCNGQEAVLKLYLDAGQARSRRQYAGQQLFAPPGLAPRPLWYDRYPEGLSRQVLIYEWAPGAALDSTDAGQMMALAQSVAQIHGTDVMEVQRFCPHPINLDYFWRVLQGGLAPLRLWLTQRHASVLLAHFDELVARADTLVTAALPRWQGVAPTPVHGDLRLENGLNCFGTALLLDWEMFGLGDPALEIANFLYLSQHDLDEVTKAAWLEEYLSQVDQPDLAQRIEIYQALLPLQSNCFLLGGLSQYLGQTPAAAVEQATDLSFLGATLNATLQQAAEKLGMAAVDWAVLTLPLFE